MSHLGKVEMSRLDLGKLAGSRSDHGVGDAPNRPGTAGFEYAFQSF